MAEKQGEALLVDHVLSVLQKTFPDSYFHKNVVAYVTLRSGQPSLVGLGKGSPDIVGCVRHPDGHGLFVGFEAKTPRGEQSTDQKSFESRLGRAGGYYRVIRSANDAVQAVKELLNAEV
jgi:hypothetical protein